MNFKIQMLAGNNLKMCVGAGFEMSSTLVCSKWQFGMGISDLPATKYVTSIYFKM